MKAIEARAARIADAAVKRRVGALAAALRDQEGVAVQAGDGGLSLSSRALLRRWLSDARLRFLSGARG